MKNARLLFVAFVMKYPKESSYMMENLSRLTVSEIPTRDDRDSVAGDSKAVYLLMVRKQRGWIFPPFLQPGSSTVE